MSEPLHELGIERHIAAPPATVWRVMTERLAEWWCPKPWTTEVRRLEWRAGGPAEMTMRGPNEGDVSEIDGVVLEVVPNQRFVFTQAFAAGWVPQKPFMVGIFTLEPDGDGTRYRATARHWDEATMEEHRKMGFDSGWKVVADQLATLAEAEPR